MASEAFERFEHNVHHGPGGGIELARNAALVVAVLAGFLAISTFLANESIKEAINGETKAAHTASLLSTNEAKINQAESNRVVLQVVGEGSPKQAHAAAAARALEVRIERHLKPIDARMREQITEDEHHRDHANDDHFIYELSVVGLELGIVLASVSIIAMRRWLLLMGAGSGVVGVVLLAFGLLN